MPKRKQEPSKAENLRNALELMRGADLTKKEADSIVVASYNAFRQGVGLGWTQYKEILDSIYSLRNGESLNPDSENYVGHVRAAQLGAPCTCPPSTRALLCPYHGR